MVLSFYTSPVSSQQLTGLAADIKKQGRFADAGTAHHRRSFFQLGAEGSPPRNPKQYTQFKQVVVPTLCTSAGTGGQAAQAIRAGGSTPDPKGLPVQGSLRQRPASEKGQFPVPGQNSVEKRESPGAARLP